MNTAAAPAWLPTFLVPFVTLSYPADTPLHPDSFHDSSYYGTGYLDVCTVISFIAAMAVLRDVTRLGVLEPFARWKLTKNCKAKRKLAQAKSDESNGSASGHSNGDSVPEKAFRLTAREERKMNHSITRFAEQGWALIYYAVQFSFGVVSVFLSLLDEMVTD